MRSGVLVGEARRTKVLIVGSGGNAMAVAAALIEAGISDFEIVTKHDEFGGVWHQNTYPGAGVDSYILTYQMRCAQSVDWTRMYPKQPEMAAYFQRVATSLGLYAHTRFETEMLDAHWLEGEARWLVRTSGPTYHTDILILATGFLEEPVTPQIPGMETFGGRMFHSSTWPEGYTGEGDRVAVVGTGSSGLQIVPALQPIATSLIVFQRSPTWVMPYEDRAFTEAERAELRRDPQTLARLRAELTVQEDEGYAAVQLAQTPGAGEERRVVALAFLEEHVRDPQLRRLLTPTTTFGCARPAAVNASGDYFRALQADNVQLVAEAATRITPQSIWSAGGTEFEVDTIVCATGFVFGGDVLHRVRRRDGRTVGEAQAGKPRAYKSIAVSGCPNLFLVGGSAPNGAIWDGLACGGITAPYIVGAIRHMEQTGIEAMEVSEDAETEWKRRADAILERGPRSRAGGGCVNYFQDEFGNNKGMWPGTMADMEAALSRFDPEVYVPVGRSKREGTNVS